MGDEERLSADYQGFHRFAAEDVAEALGPVKDLVGAVLDYLAAAQSATTADAAAEVRTALASLDRA